MHLPHTQRNQVYPGEKGIHFHYEVLPRLTRGLGNSDQRLRAGGESDGKVLGCPQFSSTSSSQAQRERRLKSLGVWRGASKSGR